MSEYAPASINFMFADISPAPVIAVNEETINIMTIITGPILLRAFSIPSNPNTTVQITATVNTTAPKPLGKFHCCKAVAFAPPHITTKLI